MLSVSVYPVKLSTFSSLLSSSKVSDSLSHISSSVFRFDRSEEKLLKQLFIERFAFVLRALMYGMSCIKKLSSEKSLVPAPDIPVFFTSNFCLLNLFLRFSNHCDYMQLFAVHCHVLFQLVCTADVMSISRHILQIFRFATVKFKTMLLHHYFIISSQVREAKMTVDIGFLNLRTAVTTDDDISS